jgi:hypothetical protein
MKIYTCFSHSIAGSSSNSTYTLELPVDCGLAGDQRQLKGGIPDGAAELLLEGAALEELGNSSSLEDELNSGTSSSLEEELDSGSTSSSLEELNSGSSSSSLDELDRKLYTG